MKFTFPSRKQLFDIALMVLIGSVGGFIAYLLSAPMPFLIGSLAFTALATIIHSQKYLRKIHFPQYFRWGCMALIGVMIGASFDNSLIALLPRLWLSFLMMIVFILVIQQLGYLYFRHIGKYDPPTATFAAMPGGLIEAIVLGVQAGGDVRLLSVLHFSRVILVAVIVPFSIFIWSGETVGSSAGESFSKITSTPEDVVSIFVLAILGLLAGRFSRLPVYHILGPLIVSSLLHAFGLFDIATPDWLLAIAQLIIGVSLGVTFSGITMKVLLRSFGLGIGFVIGALSIGLLFAFLLSKYFNLPIEDLFICFAIGGVIEMGLIALSLGINPVFVAVHHLFRIIITVLFARFFSRRFKKSDLDFSSKDI